MMFNFIETGKQREKNECACTEQYIMEKHGEELIRLGLLVYSWMTANVVTIILLWLIHFTFNFTFSNAVSFS